jgi:outer membrane lipoprotein-sorting protein
MRRAPIEGTDRDEAVPVRIEVKQPKEGRMTRLLCLGVCLLLLVAGCGGSADEEAVERKIEEATGGEAEVDLSEGSMEVKGETEEGEFSMTTGEKAEIPDDFPGDVFVYKPSVAVMSMSVPDGHSLTLATEDDQGKVMDAYKSEMEKNGWSQEGSMDMGEQKMLVFKKDERVANITVYSAEDKTQIHLIVGAE